ncbi:MAG TPA: CoA transferase [Thermoplasmata archaeon]|nr:CoA transferase [Thermoplasmata archaeon]
MTTAPTPGRLVPPFGPLTGVRVVDSGRFVAGPWAATYLGEFGAEVVHVEGPPFRLPYADPTRTLPPILPEGAPEGTGVSESWVQYGRNKLSLGLDVRRAKGREVFLDLLRRSDIWVESSRPGTYPRLGLDDATVWEVNPRLTVVHVSGFGQTGVPERVRAPSFDLVGQAFSGYLSLQGEPDPAPPMRAGTALNDTVTGMAAAAAALMGYIHAQRTGRGQAVDVAQYEVFFGLLENLALDFFMRGVVRARHGTGHARLHPYDLYRARDGWVVVAAPTEASWAVLRGVVGLDGPEWGRPEFRRAHRTEVDRHLASFCAERSVTELETLGTERDLAITRIYDIADIARDPHYRERGMFVEWNDPVAGPVKGAGVAPKFSATPGGVWRGAPTVGQDNRTVLHELLEYPLERIQELEGSGILGADTPPENLPRPTPYYRRDAR